MVRKTTVEETPEVLPKERATLTILDQAVKEIDDPLAIFISETWKQLLTLVIVGLLGWWGYSVYHSAGVSRLEGAGDTYKSARETFATLVEQRTELSKESDEKKKSELQSKILATSKRLEEITKVLHDTVPPYTHIAPLYEALLLTAKGESREKIAATLNALSWSEAKPGSSDRFLLELRALMQARALLDSPSEYKAGRALLKSLAESGEVAAAAAAMSLSKVSQSGEEVAEAKAVLNSVKTRLPDQGDLLKGE